MSTPFTSRRRRIQTLDHLDDTEMNDLVNRMFDNKEESIIEHMPWKSIWQCNESAETNNSVQSRTAHTPITFPHYQRSALKARTNQMDATPMEKRGHGKLGSLYDPLFAPSEFLDSAQKPPRNNNFRA